MITANITYKLYFFDNLKKKPRTFVYTHLLLHILQYPQHTALMAIVLSMDGYNG